VNDIPELESIHVVVAIIKNSKHEVLVSRRKSDTHLGDLLEFPGGKVEKNETSANSLRRELLEELNIQLIKSTPLIQVPYVYSDRKILLDAYLVSEYSGDVTAHEGQKIYWKSIDSLNDDDFPAANYGLIRALKLPKIFPVTPSYSQDPGNFLMKFENVVSQDSVNIIQLRSHELGSSEYMKLAKKCAVLCGDYEVQLILNSEVNSLNESQIAGIHLTSNKLLSTKTRPLDATKLVGASCHDQKEVEHANMLGLDYIFIGPVIEKNFSENSKTLEWDGFAALSKHSLIPAYAIGGLSESDIDVCVNHGGQGIAAIRSFWDLAT